MTFGQICLSIAGGFVLPFFILLVWGRLVQKWRVLGGLISAFILIGPIWLINHGAENHLIIQSGTSFVDMGLSTAVGVFVHGIFSGGKLKQSLVNLEAALLGGCLAGLLLTLIF